MSHNDGMELERTPLLQHLERPISRPQRRVRVPPVQLFFEEFLGMAGKPVGCENRITPLSCVYIAQIRPITTL